LFELRPWYFLGHLGCHHLDELLKLCLRSVLHRCFYRMYEYLPSGLLRFYYMCEVWYGNIHCSSVANELHELLGRYLCCCSRIYSLHQLRRGYLPGQHRTIKLQRMRRRQVPDHHGCHRRNELLKLFHGHFLDHYGRNRFHSLYLVCRRLLFRLHGFVQLLRMHCRHLPG